MNNKNSIIRILYKYKLYNIHIFYRNRKITIAQRILYTLFQHPRTFIKSQRAFKRGKHGTQRGVRASAI